MVYGYVYVLCLFCVFGLVFGVRVLFFLDFTFCVCHMFKVCFLVFLSSAQGAGSGSQVWSGVGFACFFDLVSLKFVLIGLFLLRDSYFSWTSFFFSLSLSVSAVQDWASSDQDSTTIWIARAVEEIVGQRFGSCEVVRRTRGIRRTQLEPPCCKRWL